MKAVIFDMDGTLIDSMGMWEDIDRKFFGRRNIIFTDDIANKVKTMSLRMSLQYFKDYYKLEESIDEIYDEFKHDIIDYYKNDAVEKEEAFNTLKKYKDLGYKVVLGTSTGYEFVKYVFDRFDLEKYFDFVITSDMIKADKSTPEFFEKIVEMLDVNPEEIYFFDDAVHAIKAANEVGIVSVGVYDDSSKNYWDEIVDEADYAIESFKEWTVK